MASRARPPASPDAAPPRGRHAALPLVGRDEHLATLTDLFEHVRSSGFGVALIEGGAGLGKTRLAEEALERCEPATLLTARAYRWGATTSFGPWVEALERHLRGLSPDDLRRLVGRRARDLAGLLPPIEHALGAAPVAVERGRLLEAFVDLFERLSRDGVVLVLLDDAHLADSSSWEALRYLARRLSGARIGVVLTARPAELARLPIATEVLVGLEQDGALHRVELAPLAPAEVTALAHAALRADSRSRSSFVPASLVSWLLERSLGHPLFVIGLLDALVDEGADLSAPRLERLPTALKDRVALDLRTLGDDQRDLIELIAVFDGRVEHRLLAEATDLPATSLDRTLETLVDRRLVTEHEHGRALHYEIAHPIIQDAIYDEIGAARRRGLHRTVAHVLGDHGHAGTAAGHHARAAGPGDDEAVEALCVAMALAEDRGLFQEVLAIQRALLEILPPTDGRWRDVFAAMDSHPEWVLSHLAENDADTAIAAAERVATHVVGDSKATAIVHLHRAAFLSFGAGRLDDAAEACRAAIRAFEQADERESVLLARNELAWILGCGGDLAGHAALAAEVLADAQSEGLDRAAVQAAGSAAYAFGCLGRTDRATALYEHSIELAGARGDTYRVAWGLAQLGGALSLVGRLDEAITSVQRAFDTDERAPDAIAFEDLAHAQWLAGDLGAALDSLDRSAVRRPVGGSRRRAWGSALAARLHLERADAGRAQAALRLAESTYGEAGFLVWGWWPRWTRALQQWQHHDLDAAATTLDAVATELSTIGAATYEALVLTELAELGAEMADTSWSVKAAERLASLDVEGELHPALTTLGAGLAALADGRAEAAAEHAGGAADALDALGYRLHAATAHHLLGRARASESRTHAVAALRRAAAELDLCGAVWRRDRVLAELTRLGSRGQRAAVAVTGPASLTPREREVAALAARGMTAREIGARLFIGRRTVETHLASCYAKLGVASKRELAHRAGELDLGPHTAAP